MMYFSNFLRCAALPALVAVLMTACGGGSAPAPTPTPTPAANVLAVTVDAGPTGGGANVNRLYTSVTVCQSGSTTRCQTIDHILVDTGSVGLRLLASAKVTALNLSPITSTGAAGLPLFNCAKFVDNTYVWGPMATADLGLGGMSALNVPIQIVGDPTYSSLGTTCSSGTAMNTVADMGANGILGLGLFTHDCGSLCVSFASNGSYFTCANASCTAAVSSSASLAKQLQNPIPLFASDNNGLIVDLPAVSSAGAASLNGSLIFGIGTRTNNQPATPAPTELTTDNVNGYLTTLLPGYANMANSFIDTGSNGLYFDANIPTCAGTASGFYCPTALTNLQATLKGVNTKATPVSFSIDNATSLFSDPSKTVLPTLSGPSGDPTSFDWGLPFFYGRRVFSGIEGQTSALGSGPFYAF